MKIYDLVKMFYKKTMRDYYQVVEEDVDKKFFGKKTEISKKDMKREISHLQPFCPKCKGVCKKMISKINKDEKKETKSIKQLLKEGYIVIDQWDNKYQGEGIKPHPKAKAKEWYFPKDEKKIIEEFEKKFPEIRQHDENVPFFAKDIKPEIKSFLLKTIAKQKQEIIEMVKGMKKKSFIEMAIEGKRKVFKVEEKGYNQALTDIIKAIKELN